MKFAMTFSWLEGIEILQFVTILDKKLNFFIFILLNFKSSFPKIFSTLIIHSAVAFQQCQFPPPKYLESYSGSKKITAMNKNCNLMIA